jgi:hypothetical protein
VVLRVGLALGAALGLARVLPIVSPLVVLPASLLVALVYGGVLIATGELGRADLELVRRVLKRRA